MMGFLGFGKKKESSASTVQSMSIPELPPLNTDLPSIDGNSMQNLPPMPSVPSDMPGIPSMQQISGENPAASQPGSDSKSLSFNMPTLDFNMPPPDEEPAAENVVATEQDMSQEGLPMDDTVVPPEGLSMQVPMSELNQGQGNNLMAGQSTGLSVDPEDLNKLFISDGWAEPDFNNFDPYPEEKIDEPSLSDFKGAELPQFGDQDRPEDTQMQAPPELKPRPEGSKPIELFIRGRAYSRVFSELDSMNASLSSFESRSSAFNEILKREDPLLMTGKEQMEYLYKKIALIDKKVFAD